MVASDLLEPAASTSLVINDISAIKDNPKPNALFMRRPPQPKFLWKPWTGQSGSGEETYRNPETACHFLPLAERMSSKWA
jgi:hypothetical protein